MDINAQRGTEHPAAILGIGKGQGVECSPTPGLIRAQGPDQLPAPCVAGIHPFSLGPSGGSNLQGWDSPVCQGL